ncbi:MAG: hypothetical protein EBS47_12695, partial [Betaproteobacteria bacterium]|nr:hypothetical protein [Betaproteobacteria bacterium]
CRSCCCCLIDRAVGGTSICGLADGSKWAVRTIVNTFRGEFEARVKPKLVPV